MVTDWVSISLLLLQQRCAVTHYPYSCMYHYRCKHTVPQYRISISDVYSTVSSESSGHKKSTVGGSAQWCWVLL